MPEQIAALFARHTQTTRLLRLTTPLGSDRLLAESVQGEEAINQAYTFTITALSLDAGIPLRALIGQPALLQLLTVDRQAPRAFHGHVTAVECNGANGGMARYTLTLQPWTTFLGLTRDSRIFQHMSVLEILDAVFGAWRQRSGKLIPAWRFAIADSTSYPIRSLTTQYQESDLAFAERLMNEAGLFYFFEHEADETSCDFGRHQLVIADHNGVFTTNSQPTIRYTQPGAVMKEDSMDRWRRAVQLQTDAIELRSWDYRSLNQRPVTSSGSCGATRAARVARDIPGPYAYPSRAQGQRMADRKMQALEARQDIFTGAGTVRTLAPGTTFALSGHALHDKERSDTRRFLVTRVVHRMHNNLDADIASHIAPQAQGEAPERSPAGERPLYRNRIDAIRASLPYRASQTDNHGNPLYPRPAVRGQQTAIVVGPPGAVIHTDRDHRIKLQFHWQRDANTHMSHSRLTHPYPDKHSGAPGDDRAGTWVRVATSLAPIAGANWGSHAVPRVGQEVLVDFLEGDIDRPVVIGTLYNGLGASDAQHNQLSAGAGAVTGNAPAWFPGAAGPHAHPAVISGLKSQAMQSSQIGAGPYGQLIFDDSPGQARVSLQRHARAHEGTAELNLGHLRHQADNQRLQAVGLGAELKTEHSLALRAGRGLLLTTDERNGARGVQLDAHEARQQIDASIELQENLALTAEKHRAGASACALEAMKQGAQVIDAPETGYTQAQLQLSSPKGIALTTPANIILNAAKTSSIVAGQAINAVANGNSFHTVKAGITLFTYGKRNAQDKPNQETGIALHAARGKVSAQSQAGETRVTADKNISVVSVSRSVVASASKHVLMTVQGAFLKLEGGNIMLHAPGKVEFKASMKELAGPADGSSPLPTLPQAKDIYNESFVVLDDETKVPMAYVRYRLESASGVKIEGMTDALGRTQRIFTSRSEKLTLFLPKEE